MNVPATAPVLEKKPDDDCPAAEDELLGASVEIVTVVPAESPEPPNPEYADCCATGARLVDVEVGDVAAVVVDEWPVADVAAWTCGWEVNAGTDWDVRLVGANEGPALDSVVVDRRKDAGNDTEGSVAVKVGTETDVEKIEGEINATLVTVPTTSMEESSLLCLK